MDSLPSVRMTANLNSMIRGQQFIEQAERAIVNGDVAHHVVDPDGALGLDPLQASTLDVALRALLAAEPHGSSHSQCQHRLPHSVVQPLSISPRCIKAKP
jgi:hypothetical protein